MAAHGLLLVDKPAGFTSHDVVAKTRRILGLSAVGHTGTLDPMATGLMVLLLGEATKLSSYILEKDKTYQLRAQLGVETDTWDMTGEIVARRDVVDSVRWQDPQAQSTLVQALSGPLMLPVPRFSAIKVNGERLHKKARRGDEFEAPERLMSFYDVHVMGAGDDWIDIQMSCGKGGFVRSWVQRLGQVLGTGATTSVLRRLACENFHVGQALTLEKLQDWIAQGKSLSASGSFIPIGHTLDHLKGVRLPLQGRRLLSNGQISMDLKRQLWTLVESDVDSEIRVLSEDGKELIALLGFQKGKGFNIRRVFRY